MDWKSDQEWIIMRYFTEHCPHIPKGKLVKGESPDFQLWISTKRFIGIELTQVHQFNAENPSQCVLTAESGVFQIEETLRAKEEKIALYRSDHPYKLWLVIFVDYSQTQAMEKAVRVFENNGIKTTFDKVYLFDLDTHLSFQMH